MNTHPHQNAIRARAHQLWEQRGCPIGSPEIDWQEAERQLQGPSSAAKTPSQRIDESSQHSFPASDPPASRTPDEPPVNADAKWAAAGVDRDELSRSMAIPVLPNEPKEKRRRGANH